MINDIVSLFQLRRISLKVCFNQVLIDSRLQALMAEWLRRVIRNHLGSSRAGSNPVQCALLLIFMRILRTPRFANAENEFLTRLPKSYRKFLNVS